MNKYIKYFAVILLLGSMWWVFFFARIVLQESNNTNLNFIPKNAEIVVSVNGELLLEEALATVVFQRHDPEIFSLIENYRKRDTEQKYKLFGIDYLSEVVLFSMPVKKRTVVGALFNLNNSKAFKKNFLPMLSENQVLYATNDIGLIMTQKPQKNAPLFFKNDFKLLAKDLLDNPSDNNIDDFFNESETILKTWMNGSTKLFDNAIKYVNLNANISGRSIDLEGTLQLKEPEDFISSFIGSKIIALKPSGLHLSSRIIPARTNDFVRSFFGDSIPELYGFSINYFTSQFVKDSENTILPYADVLLQFKDKVDLHAMLRSNSDIANAGQHSFRYKGSEMYYRQLNDSTIYIGKNEFTQHSYVTISELTLLSGDLNAIAKIEGNGFLLQVIRMTRFFNSCEDFLNSVAACRIYINTPVDDRSKIEGSIQFKDDISALNALLKLGIRGQFLD